MIGPTLAHYRITAKLGEGGMGAVYRATDTKLNRDVAIKVLPDAFASDTDRLARFTREAQVLASLNHPNIAAIYGVEERAIIMELVEGQELKGPLDLDTALAYAAQIADALDAAHEKGITHRDLKPANIKVTPQGTIKVLDFGLAKIAEPQQPASTATSPTLTIRATEAGLIMGTASYMSPEQARGQAVDKRADIWAFGVILWELLTGRQMFEGDTVSDVLASVLKSSPDLEAVPPKVRRLLARCLEKDSRKRLRDISVWRELLVEAAPPDTTAAPAHARRNWILPGIAVCGVLCGFLLAEWLRPPQPSPAAPVARFSLPPAHLSARVSPDGRWLVYPDPDQAALRVRSLEETASRTLSGTDGANIRTLFWSEDSQAFGCVMGGRLRLVALDGGRVVELGSVSDFRGGTWRGANGRIVAAIGRKLRTIELPTREAHDLPLPFREDEVPKGPQFLPEGNAFVYILESKDEKIRLVRSSLGSNAIERLFDTSGAVEFARHPHSGQWYCLFVQAEEGERQPRILLAAPVDPQAGILLAEPRRVLQGVSRTPELRRFAFSVSNTGILSWRQAGGSIPVWRLLWYDQSGNVSGRIGDPSQMIAVDLSPDETKAAVQLEDPEPRIWIYDLQSGIRKQLSKSAEAQFNPYWTPDGKAVYFMTRSEGTSRIVRQSPEFDGQREVIWESKQPGWRLSDVSSDGRYAILTSGDSIYRLGLGAPQPRSPELLLRAPGPVYAVRLSHDSRTIAFQPGVGLGLWSAPFLPGGEAPRGIPGSETASWPFFSADDRTLYGITLDRLLSFPVAPDQSIGKGSVRFQFPHVDRAGSKIAIASKDGKRILAISTEATEQVGAQIITDWTTLLAK